MARKKKDHKNQNDFYWVFTPAEVVLYQSIQSSYLIWRAFDVRPVNFPPFSKVRVSCEVVWGIFDQLFCLIFKMEFNPLPDLVNTGFINVEISLFYGGEHLGAKICRFLTCFDKITSRWRFSTYLLNRGWRRVKTLQILVVFF